MDSPLPNYEVPQYFDKEMQEELFVAYARREALRIITKLERYKLASDIERHLKYKFKDTVASS